MNPFLLLVCCILMFIGVRLCFSEAAPVKPKNIETVIRYLGSPVTPEGFTEKILGRLIPFIERFVKLSDYRREDLKYQLESAHLFITPENYIAQNLSIALLTAVLSLLLGILFSPVLYMSGAVATVFVYRNQSSRAIRGRKEIDEKIEACMADFASYVCSYIRVDRDVLALLSRYSGRCPDRCLREELEITISDASSSGIEPALIRLNSRSRSPKLSSIVRALISLSEGNCNLGSFEQLEEQFIREEKERLRKKACDIPSQLKPYNYGLYISFAVMLTVLFITIFIQSAAQLL